jgi:hypothetical protein
MNKIPCFVISYNRPTFLKKCVEALAHEERVQIYIIDNGTPVDVWNKNGGLDVHVEAIFKNKINYGHTVLWNKEFQESFSQFGFDFSFNEPYIVTDCDIIVPWKLPWLDVLLQGMERLPKYNKFGLGLNTRHIPDGYPSKSEVLHHENHVIYKNPIGDARFIEAPVDTTLALYRPGYTKYSIWGNDSPLEWAGECNSVRTFAPYEATHLTWHMTKEELAGEEHKNYCKSIKSNSTHWSK